MKCTLQYFLA
jgi:hypothetical protein